MLFGVRVRVVCDFLFYYYYVCTGFDTGSNISIILRRKNCDRSVNHKVRRGSDGNKPRSAEGLKLPEVKVQFENIILDVCGLLQLL